MARTGQAGLIALVVALALSRPSLAQDSVTEFQLPPAPTPSARPSVQGPVDPENPIGTRPTPRASAAPMPAPSPQPSITLPPVAEPTRPAPSARPSPRASQRAAPGTTGQPTASPPQPQATEPDLSAEATDIAPLPAPPAPSPAPVFEPDTKVASSDRTPDWWQWALLALGLGIAGAIAAWFLAKRRRRALVQELEAEAPAAPAPAPPPALQPGAPAALAPSGRVSAPPRRATPSLADAPREISLAIEPVSLRVSLAYATLICRVAITNNTDADSGPLALRGDLATAHRAVDQRATLSPLLAELDPLASIESIPAGTASERRIEVKLPLDRILGFLKGGHQFFVPLVRLALVPHDGEASVRIWTVGTAGNERLGPICADTPRLFADLGAIEIETKRWLALDPVLAAS
ncbi:hypothetical protein [Novosphingobium aquimarinum]|uniref:hypothetical protein n=1 Tax=Novosphingobium aquimarinum TaxID=2682494 RepID=UPI0012EB2E75|nr:hypothetical protein [Novosphingobium aquimarinum]